MDQYGITRNWYGDAYNVVRIFEHDGQLFGLTVAKHDNLESAEADAKSRGDYNPIRFVDAEGPPAYPMVPDPR